MQTPGPASVWFWSAAETAKFEKEAYLSSVSDGLHDGGPPTPPDAPALPALAVTVRTSLYAAGTTPAKSEPLLPAATTNVTPLADALQIAMCMASPFEFPQLASSAPLPPRLMLATRMFFLVPGPCAATQSIPQMICANVPTPVESNTLTAKSRVPGETPTTLEPLFLAAIVPAMCVP